MANGTETLAAEVARLEIEVGTARAELARLNTVRHNLGLIYDTWTPQIQDADRAVFAQVQVVSALEATLQERRKALEQRERAIAQAMSEGLTEEAAAIAVDAAEKRKKVWMVVGVGVVVVAVIVLVWWQLKRRATA